MQQIKWTIKTNKRLGLTVIVVIVYAVFLIDFQLKMKISKSQHVRPIQRASFSKLKD